MKSLPSVAAFCFALAFPAYAQEREIRHVELLQGDRQDDTAVSALAASSHATVDVLAPGVMHVKLVSAGGQTLLEGHADHNAVTIDGLLLVMHGPLIEFYDNGSPLGVVDVSKPPQELVDISSTANRIARHIADTRHNRAPLFTALSVALQNVNNVHQSDWCDFGAGCACNGATLVTVGTVLGVAGAALSNNWLGYAGGLVILSTVYYKQMSACPGWM